MDANNNSQVNSKIIFKNFLCFNVFDFEGKGRNVHIRDYCVIALSGKPEEFKDIEKVESKLKTKMLNLTRESEDFYDNFAKLGYVELPDEVSRYTKPVFFFDRTNYDKAIARRSISKILNSTAKEEMDIIYGYNSEE